MDQISGVKRVMKTGGQMMGTGMRSGLWMHAEVVRNAGGWVAMSAAGTLTYDDVCGIG